MSADVVRTFSECMYLHCSYYSHVFHLVQSLQVCTIAVDVTVVAVVLKSLPLKVNSNWKYELLLVLNFISME